MPAITVCIPAYRSAAFLPQTLASVRAQTFTDFVVKIAVEPEGADESLAACADFMADQRFEFTVNERAYGWPANVQNVLERVDTPLFTILPHDDLLHPRYLEALVGTLQGRADAICAYADSYLFRPPAGVRTYDIRDAEIGTRLLDFYLGGAEGWAWRGLSRREVLDRPFPDNEFSGFAVECEWVGHLLVTGRVLHHPEPLYLKRQREDDEDSVSVGWRLRMDPNRLRSALAHHRRRLVALIEEARLPTTDVELVTLAAEAALLIRWVAFSRGRFDMDADERERVRSLVDACAGLSAPPAKKIEARFRLAMSRYLLQRGEREEGLSEAQSAVSCAADYPDAALHLARILLRRERPLEALPLLHAAAIAAPMAIGLAELESECSRQLTAQHELPA